MSHALIFCSKPCFPYYQRNNTFKTRSFKQPRGPGSLTFHQQISKEQYGKGQEMPGRTLPPGDDLEGIGEKFLITINHLPLRKHEGLSLPQTRRNPFHVMFLPLKPCKRKRTSQFHIKMSNGSVLFPLEFGSCKLFDATSTELG